MPFVYILECADASLYTGWTTNLQRRVKAHNAGSGGRYTRTRRPVRLAYWEWCQDRAQAQQREIQIKRYPRSRKLALVEDFGAESRPVPDNGADQA